MTWEEKKKNTVEAFLQPPHPERQFRNGDVSFIKDNRNETI